MLPEFTDRLLQGCVIVQVRGEVDYGSAPALDQGLSAVLTMREPPVVLDLSGLTFIDCAAVGVLAAARRRAAAHGTALVLAAPRPIVARTLQITGLDRQFAVFPAVAKAVAARRTGWPRTGAGQTEV
jgi:anti-sigma B factor antagonist